MKLSCQQENLNRGLTIVGRAVAARSTLPITQNILLSAEKSRLKLAATNLEMATTCWIGSEVKKEGDITVPARLLIDLTRSTCLALDFAILAAISLALPWSPRLAPSGADRPLPR